MRKSDFHLNKILKKGGDKMSYIISTHTVNGIKFNRIAVTNDDDDLAVIAFDIDNKIIITSILKCDEQILKNFIDFCEAWNWKISYEGCRCDAFSKIFKSIGRSDIYNKSFIFELWELFGLENPFSELIEELI